MKLLQMIRAFIQEIKKDNITIHASSAAFFIFLSLIPMLILICSILPYTPVREADLMRAVTDLLPTTLDAFAVDLIEDEHPLYCGRAGNMGDRPGNWAIQNADLILVLNQGRIVERGTNDELMAQHGYYYDMIRLQNAAHVD